MLFTLGVRVLSTTQEILLSFWGGELNTFGSEFRIARANDSKTFGWKINARLILVMISLMMKMNQTLAAKGIGINRIIRQPVITNKYVDPVLSQNGDVLYDFSWRKCNNR